VCTPTHSFFLPLQVENGVANYLSSFSCVRHSHSVVWLSHCISSLGSTFLDGNAPTVPRDYPSHVARGSKDCFIYFNQVKTDSLLFVSLPFNVDWVDWRRIQRDRAKRVSLTMTSTILLPIGLNAFHPLPCLLHTVATSIKQFHCDSVTRIICMVPPYGGKRAMVQWLYFTSLFRLLFFYLNNALGLYNVPSSNALVISVLN
jgi:hypothetical protein